MLKNAGAEAGEGKHSPSLLPCLGLSLLLHALVILMPPLGTVGQPARAAKRASSEIAKPLRASLTVLRAEPIPAPVLRTEPEAGRISAPVPQSGARESVAAESRGYARGADILPLPEPDYYTTDLLSKRPRALVIAELDPEENRSIIVSGNMILRLWINVRGHIVHVEVEESGLPQAITGAAVGAFRRSRFSPGERNGKRVGVLMRVEVRYEDQRLTGLEIFSQ